MSSSEKPSSERTHDPYPDHREKLSELLKVKNIDALTLQGFFDATEVSQGLRGLLGVAKNLLSLIPHIQNDPKNHLDVENLKKVSQAILECTKKELSNIDPILLETSETKKGVNALKYLYPPRPLHCFLWHSNQWRQKNNEFIRFKAYFFLAYRRLADNLIPPPTDPDYEPAITFLPSCCLAGRKVANMDAGHFEYPAINKFRDNLSNQVGFEAYYTKTISILNELKDIARERDSENTFRNLKNLFKGRYPGTREANTDEIEEPTDPEIQPTPRPPHPPADVEILDVPYGPVVITIPPEQGKPGGQLLKIRPKKPKYTTEDDKFLYMAHRGRVNMISMSNQSLPWAWDRLSEYETEVLRSELADDAKFTRFESKENLLSPRLLRAFISFAFYTGRGGSSFCSVRSGKPVNTDDEQSYYNNGELNFPTFEPQSDTVSEIMGSRPHLRRLKLKVNTDLTRAINEWNPSPTAGTVWCEDLLAGRIESAASEWFKRFNMEFDTRLSLAKVKGHLYRTLTSKLDSDEAMAIAITGSPRANTYSPASYQALHPTVLQRHYDLVFNEGEIPPNINLPLAESDAHIGSAKVPRRLSTNLLAFDLQREISLKSMYEYHDSFVNLHNLFAIYTYLMIGFCTGFRHTINPFSHPAYFDESTSELVLSDKDGDNFAHARAVWLPQIAADQVRHYLDHLQSIEEQLVLIDPELAGGKIAHRQPHARLAGRRTNIANVLAKAAAFIFIIDENGKRSPLSSGVANTWLEKNQFGKLHDNAWRQSYRTQLRESNCPDRVVRAAMGHWRAGEEGFYRYSAMLPEVYRSVLEKHITPIVKAQGWEAIQSPQKIRK